VIERDSLHTIAEGEVHRAGLAAAMRKVVVDKAPKARAKERRAHRYGHLPLGKPPIG
jgi:hypothetical protein